MDLINKEKIIIEELVSIYSEDAFIKELKITAENIANHFKTLLNDLGEKNDLISKNSVRELKYFSLVFRVKEPDSLNEKFYRGNLLQEDFKEMTFTSGADVKRQRDDVKLIFKKCDDVIGIKILTELNEDCKKVISILRNNESFLRRQDIELDKRDLAAQPVPMKNGLDIYKIKGKFNTRFSFELQIKSKIQSVWGDMEHSIFYKDYFISPVRESNQATMNHIGKMLFQIDEFLLSVRNANKEFKSNSEVIAFLTWFDEKYSIKIRKKLGGIGFKIDSITEVLYHIQSKNKPIVRELQFDHFKIKSNVDNFKDYVNIRISSYDVKIFESIVFGWFWNKSQILNGNIDLKYKKYFELIEDFLISKIKEKNEGLKTIEIQSMLANYFKKTLPYKPKPKIYFSPKDYLKHMEFMSFVKNTFEIKGKKTFDLKFKEIDLLFFNKRMGGNCREQINSMRISNVDEEVYREILGTIDTEIKLQQRTDCKDEIVFITEIISEFK